MLLLSPSFRVSIATHPTLEPFAIVLCTLMRWIFFLEVSPQTIDASVHAVMTLSLLAEGMSHNDCQKRTFSQVNVFSSMSKEHPAIFYVMPHSVKLSEDYLLAEAQSFIFSCFRLLSPFL